MTRHITKLEGGRYAGSRDLGVKLTRKQRSGRIRSTGQRLVEIRVRTSKDWRGSRHSTRPKGSDIRRENGGEVGGIGSTWERTV